MALLNHDIEVMGGEAIKAIKPLLAPLSAFSLKISEDGNTFTEGDVVKVGLVGVADDATEYNSSSNNYETDNSGDDDVANVTIDKHPKSSFPYTPAEMKRLSAREYQLKINTHVEKVAKKVFKDLFGIVTVANFGAAIETLADASWVYDDVVDLKTAYIKATGITSGINLVNSYDMFGALKKDGAISDASAFGGNTAVAMSGDLNMIDGVRILPSNEIPDNSEQLSAIITNGAGLAFASTIIPMGDTFTGDWTVITDPITGMQFVISVDYVKATRSFVTTVEAWYGVGVGKAAFLKRVQKAAIT